jgi:hypothetical protein
VGSMLRMDLDCSDQVFWSWEGLCIGEKEFPFERALDVRLSLR